MLESICKTLGGWEFFHLLHPVIACLPMGLLMGGFLFFLTSLMIKSASLGQTAYHCLMLAWISLVPTGITGLLDWSYFYKSSIGGPILGKMILLPLLFFLIGFVTWMMRRSIARPHRLVTGYLLCLNIALSLAYYGAQFLRHL